MAKENKPDFNIEQQKRRKIVKGIAGLPALVTLASGSAAANTSILQCVQDSKYRPDSSVVREDCIDEAVQQNGYYVEAGDDAARIGGNEEYCLVYVDQDGQLVHPDLGTPQQLVTTSCYTSFATSAITTMTRIKG